MASQNRRYNNKSGANHSEGSSNASSPASSINLSNTNQGNNNNAPKYGTLVPNRVFVGGISSTTTEEELCQLFKKYGNVKDTKIIVDRAGVSKGYGFVTFESEDEAKLLQRDADNIVLKERRLNIAPAIKKQPFNRSFETPTSPPPIAAPNIYYHNGIPYTYHNGMAFFTPTNTPAVPALPAPPADPNAVFQAYGPQPTAPPTYSPTLMYSCANPGPPMFMPTQYHPYQHLPMTNGGPYIYNGTGTPSTGRSSPVNTPENVPASHLPALPAPPPPAYYTPSYQQAEMCFSAIPQGMYPFYTVNTTQEGYVQYCDVSQTVDPPSSNMSSEDTSSTTSVPTSDQTASGETRSQSNMSTRDNDNTFFPSHHNNSHLRNAETPVVSLLSLQQNGEERERSVRPLRKQGSSSVDSQTNSHESFSLQASVGMMVYQPPGIYHTQALQQGVMYNGHMMPRSQFIYPPRNQNVTRNGQHFFRGSRGGYRGRNRSAEPISSNLPFVPKFPPHFNNNNPAFANNNYYQPKRIQDSSPSRNLVSSGGRGGRSSNRGGYMNSQASPSPPPAPYSPMTRPYMFCGSNPSLTSSPPPQVPQQFIQTRQYYNPSHQYNIPPPLPPKRYQNSSKKSNGSNNMVGNGGMNSRGKYRGNNNSGPTIIDKSALVGAGDAPSLLHLSLTPPVTPSLTVNTNSSAQSASTTSMELSTQMKTLTI